LSFHIVVFELYIIGERYINIIHVIGLRRRVRRRGPLLSKNSAVSARFRVSYKSVQKRPQPPAPAALARARSRTPDAALPVGPMPRCKSHLSTLRRVLSAVVCRLTVRVVLLRLGGRALRQQASPAAALPSAPPPDPVSARGSTKEKQTSAT
jgi:hypothetical protein